ncbi:MAG: O-antigen/teichoic acid export membrane protein [Paraglaciecola sp.]|jgi:O-antigen/teichoic acid export membrane protein
MFLPLLSSFNSVQIALLQHKFAFKQLAIRSFISTFIAGIVGVVYAYYGYGAWALVIN